jgi:hypothetical protein
METDIKIIPKPIEQFDAVRITRDFPEHGLKKGQSGTALDPVDGGAVWLVEFSGPEGIPITEDPVPDIAEKDLEIIWRMPKN